MESIENSSTLSFSDFEKKTRPVFIFGSARSGTTLTFNVMKFHPQVSKLAQDTYFFEHFWNVRKKIPIKTQCKILFWTCNLAHVPPKSSSDELERDKELQKTLLSYLKEGDPVTIFNFISYISYVKNADNHNAVAWWAERTNNHLYYYQTLKKWFPLCKFIFCIRDPRAVIASAFGAHKLQGDYESSRSDYCADSAIDWGRAGRIALEMKRTFKDDVFVSKYESFVEAPINHINNMWRFLELPEMNESELSEKIDGLGQIYISKTGVKRPTGIDTKSVARWKELLLPSDIMMIEDITKEVAEKYGYKFGNNKVSITFYMKKFPGDSFRMYIKRIVKIFIFKLSPSRSY